MCDRWDRIVCVFVCVYVCATMMRAVTFFFLFDFFLMLEWCLCSVHVALSSILFHSHISVRVYAYIHKILVEIYGYRTKTITQRIPCTSIHTHTHTLICELLFGTRSQQAFILSAFCCIEPSFCNNDHDRNQEKGRWKMTFRNHPSHYAPSHPAPDPLHPPFRLHSLGCIRY